MQDVKISRIQTMTEIEDETIYNFTLINATDGGDGDNSAVVLAAAGLGLYALSLLTIVGNAMVLHAIRTEKSLQTVKSVMHGG